MFGKGFSRHQEIYSTHCGHKADQLVSAGFSPSLIPSLHPQALPVASTC